MSRLELYRGGSEDHYIAAFVEPSAYALAVEPAEPDRLDDPDLAHRGALDLREPAGLDRRPAARPARRPRPAAAADAPRCPPLRRRADEPQEHPPALRRQADALPGRSRGAAGRDHRHRAVGGDGAGAGGRRGPLRRCVHRARPGHPQRRARLPGPEPEPGDQAVRGRDAGVCLRPRPVADPRPGGEVRGLGGGGGQPPAGPRPVPDGARPGRGAARGPVRRRGTTRARRSAG